MDEQILTNAEWACLSAESRHKLNMMGKENQAMRAQLNAQDAYINNIRIALNNFFCHDSELGWQVKMLKLKIQELTDKLKGVLGVQKS